MLGRGLGLLGVLAVEDDPRAWLSACVDQLAARGQRIDRVVLVSLDEWKGILPAEPVLERWGSLAGALEGIGVELLDWVVVRDRWTRSMGETMVPVAGLARTPGDAG